jgi:hypothetical protein
MAKEWPANEISSINKYKVVQEVKAYIWNGIFFVEPKKISSGTIITGIITDDADKNDVRFKITEGECAGRYLKDNKSAGGYKFIVPLEGDLTNDKTLKDYKGWPAAVISQSGKYKVKRAITVDQIQNNKLVEFDTLPKGWEIEGTLIPFELNKDIGVLMITKCDKNKDFEGKLITTMFSDIFDTYPLEIVPLKNGETPSTNPINETKTNTKQEQTVSPEDHSQDTNNANISTDNTNIYEEEMLDYFQTESTALIDDNAYKDGLAEGLRIKSMRGVMGMPQQFLPITDPRIGSSQSVGDNDLFGRVYSEKIIKNIPLLLMAPGVPRFLTKYKRGNVRNLIQGFEGDENGIDDLMDGKTGKFYTLEYQYKEYYYYVNTMLRSAAIFLGIENEKISGKNLVGKEDDGTALWANNWKDETSLGGNNVLYDTSLSNFLKPYANCIAFYADAGNTVDDSFSNNTGDSELKGMINGLSDKAREMSFLLGTASSELGLKYDAIMQTTDGIADSLINTVNNILGGNSGLGRILGKASTILAGGRIILPEIWNDSSFSRSYSCSMKLVSPSGDKLSIFMNILVPIYHLLGLTLPREASDQAYMSPFLVRAYYKGLFNVDMGIISGLNITKGDEGEWTVDGLPTVANVSFDIKDLYSGLYMSKSLGEGRTQGILSNIQELDYIANSCGINVNDHEIGRMVKLAAALKLTGVQDKISLGIFSNIGQHFNNKVQQIFGVFR